MRTSEERAAWDFEVHGFRVGQPKKVLANYENVQKLPGFRAGFEEFHILNPMPQISMLALFFREDILRRIEIRYFNGPTASTLRRAGGWRGIFAYMQNRFGEPTERGERVAVISTQPGLQAKYAKENAVWQFPRVRRQINFIAMEDARGGVAIVTVSDTTPVVRRAVAVERDFQAEDMRVLEAAAGQPATVTDVAREQTYQVIDPGF